MKKFRFKKSLIAVLAVVLLLTGGCFGYLLSYYRADGEAIDAFAIGNAIEITTLENGDMVFAPEDAKAGFIFYPGGKVEYSAYIPLMKACADRGVLCILVKMPFNLAVFDINGAQGLQEKYPEIADWYIGGHSLGGSMAASYLEKSDEDFKGIILLASYSTADLSDNGISALSVYGSEDGVLNLEKYKEYSSNLPNDFIQEIIEGANHAGFGMYGKQKGDGSAEISNEEQIEITAEIIKKFSHELS